jgi:hypothetical protein
MVITFDFWAVAGGLLIVILVLLEVGRRIGLHRRKVDPDHASAGLGAIEGAVFGLMGLLIAFTFSGAAERFDHRRQLVGEEANKIEAAYLRVDLLPPATQPQLKQDFREYLDFRLAMYDSMRNNTELSQEDFARAKQMQHKIWAEALVACGQQNSPAVTTLVMSSLNDMIDVTTKRLVAMQTHPPEVVFYGLGLLVMASSLLAGYGMAGSRKRSWMHVTVFAVITAATLYVILDMEFPRFGLIRIDAADQVLIDVRNNMK